MSFAKIAEARAVKKIVAMLRTEAAWRSVPDSPSTYLYAAVTLERIADDIEAGRWKDIKLPPSKKKKK